ncbi:MAG: hypothetical protein HUU06_06030 [Planctomycetaceae bacterium]|nr:hypothetical protein [Planctomycetota bacterium]NUN52331.1 hypothetical protein [Planctomycetaceae bacterium]
MVVYIVEDNHDDTALVWRRVAPDGQVSAPLRIPLPALIRRIEKVHAIAVDADGNTLVAHSTWYSPDENYQGWPLETETEILRIAEDGTLLGRLPIGASAERVRLVAHGPLVDVAYDAEVERPGDRAVYWRQIGADGAFINAPVRLSAPPDRDDPDLITGIWDVFLGVSDDGVARVLYRWVEGRVTGGAIEVTAGPEVFWHSVSSEGGASQPVSLGLVPDGNESWSPAFAPDGTVCLASYQGLLSLESRTSFPMPLVVAPQGEVREAQRRTSPRLLSIWPGMQVGVGADAESMFHVATFSTTAFRRKVRSDHRVPAAVFLATMDREGTVDRIRRYPMRRPQYVSAFVVAEDGTTAIAGVTETPPVRPPAWRSANDVTVLFKGVDGRRPRGKTFRSPNPIGPNQPILASSTVAGSRRFAAAWSTWLIPADEEKPANRQVRVALFE